MALNSGGGVLRTLADRLERLNHADAHEVLLWMQPHVAGLHEQSERVLASAEREPSPPPDRAEPGRAQGGAVRCTCDPAS
jgi:hypothetical protein